MSICMYSMFLIFDDTFGCGKVCLYLAVHAVHDLCRRFKKFRADDTLADIVSQNACGHAERLRIASTVRTTCSDERADQG